MKHHVHHVGKLIERTFMQPEPFFPKVSQNGTNPLLILILPEAIFHHVALQAFFALRNIGCPDQAMNHGICAVQKGLEKIGPQKAGGARQQHMPCLVDRRRPHVQRRQ